MITCLKHKTKYEQGECPRCKELRLGISVSYKSTNPEHISKFISNKVAELNNITAKLKIINERIEKLLKGNK